MSQLLAAMREARRAGDTVAAAALIPYARTIGMRFEECADGGLLFRLPYSAHLVGNPTVPALHGGVVGGFLENAALLELLWHDEAQRLPKVVDFSLDYLRSARAQALLARCEIQRRGLRIANVALRAYQSGDYGDRHVAVARGHFLAGS